MNVTVSTSPRDESPEDVPDVSDTGGTSADTVTEPPKSGFAIRALKSIFTPSAFASSKQEQKASECKPGKVTQQDIRFMPALPGFSKKSSSESNVVGLVDEFDDSSKAESAFWWKSELEIEKKSFQSSKDEADKALQNQEIKLEVEQAAHAKSIQEEEKAAEELKNAFAEIGQLNEMINHEQVAHEESVRNATEAADEMHVRLQSELDKQRLETWDMALRESEKASERMFAQELMAEQAAHAKSIQQVATAAAERIYQLQSEVETERKIFVSSKKAEEAMRGRARVQPTSRSLVQSLVPGPSTQGDKAQDLNYAFGQIVQLTEKCKSEQKAHEESMQKATEAADATETRMRTQLVRQRQSMQEAYDKALRKQEQDFEQLFETRLETEQAIHAQIIQRAEAAAAQVECQLRSELDNERKSFQSSQDIMDKSMQSDDEKTTQELSNALAEVAQLTAKCNQEQVSCFLAQEGHEEHIKKAAEIDLQMRSELELQRKSLQEASNQALQNQEEVAQKTLAEELEAEQAAHAESIQQAAATAADVMSQMRSELENERTNAQASKECMDKSGLFMKGLLHEREENATEFNNALAEIGHLTEKLKQEQIKLEEKERTTTEAVQEMEARLRSELDRQRQSLQETSDEALRNQEEKSEKLLTKELEAEQAAHANSMKEAEAAAAEVECQLMKELNLATSSKEAMDQSLLDKETEGAQELNNASAEILQLKEKFKQEQLVYEEHIRKAAKAADEMQDRFLSELSRQRQSLQEASKEALQSQEESVEKLSSELEKQEQSTKSFEHALQNQEKVAEQQLTEEMIQHTAQSAAHAKKIQHTAQETAELERQLRSELESERKSFQSTQEESDKKAAEAAHEMESRLRYALQKQEQSMQEASDAAVKNLEEAAEGSMSEALKAVQAVHAQNMAQTVAAAAEVECQLRSELENERKNFDSGKEAMNQLLRDKSEKAAQELNNAFAEVVQLTEKCNDIAYEMKQEQVEHEMHMKKATDAAYEVELRLRSEQVAREESMQRATEETDATETRLREQLAQQIESLQKEQVLNESLNLQLMEATAAADETGMLHRGLQSELERQKQSSDQALRNQEDLLATKLEAEKAEHAKSIQQAAAAAAEVELDLRSQLENAQTIFASGKEAMAKSMLDQEEKATDDLNNALAKVGQLTETCKQEQEAHAAAAAVECQLRSELETEREMFQSGKEAMDKSMWDKEEKATQDLNNAFAEVAQLTEKYKQEQAAYTAAAEIERQLRSKLENEREIFQSDNKSMWDTMRDKEDQATQELNITFAEVAELKEKFKQEQVAHKESVKQAREVAEEMEVHLQSELERQRQTLQEFSDSALRNQEETADSLLTDALASEQASHARSIQRAAAVAAERECQLRCELENERKSSQSSQEALDKSNFDKQAKIAQELDTAFAAINEKQLEVTQLTEKCKQEHIAHQEAVEKAAVVADEMQANLQEELERQRHSLHEASDEALRNREETDEKIFTAKLQAEQAAHAESIHKAVTTAAEVEHQLRSELDSERNAFCSSKEAQDKYIWDKEEQGRQDLSKALAEVRELTEKIKQGQLEQNENAGEMEVRLRSELETQRQSLQDAYDEALRKQEEESQKTMSNELEAAQAAHAKSIQQAAAATTQLEIQLGLEREKKEASDMATRDQEKASEELLANQLRDSEEQATEEVNKAKLFLKNSSAEVALLKEKLTEEQAMHADSVKEVNAAAEIERQLRSELEIERKIQSSRQAQQSAEDKSMWDRKEDSAKQAFAEELERQQQSLQESSDKVLRNQEAAHAQSIQQAAAVAAERESQLRSELENERKRFQSSQDSVDKSSMDKEVFSQELNEMKARLQTELERERQTLQEASHEALRQHEEAAENQLKTRLEAEQAAQAAQIGVSNSKQALADAAQREAQLRLELQKERQNPQFEEQQAQHAKNIQQAAVVAAQRECQLRSELESERKSLLLSKESTDAELKNVKLLLVNAVTEVGQLKEKLNQGQAGVKVITAAESDEMPLGQMWQAKDEISRTLRESYANNFRNMSGASAAGPESGDDGVLEALHPSPTRKKSPRPPKDRVSGPKTSQFLYKEPELEPDNAGFRKALGKKQSTGPWQKEAYKMPDWLDSFVRDDAQKDGTDVQVQPQTFAVTSSSDSSEPEPDSSFQFIKRKGSSTVLGPAATKKSSDQEQLRGASLSCLRDVVAQAEALVADDVQPKPKYNAKHTDVPVVVVTSEVNPFSKTGGLALVCQSYGMEFPKRGHRTMVVAPMYDHYPNCDLVGSTRIWLMGGETEVKFFHQALDQGAGIWTDFVFVDHPCYHRHGGLYCDAKEGTEYQDNLFRFALFSIAALEAPKLRIGKRPYGEKVVFVTNDWQSALVPVYLVHRYRPRGEYKDARCMFVVHNFGFQGIYPLMKNPHEKNVAIEDLGLDPRYVWNDLVYTYPQHERAYADDVGHVLNLSKGALHCSDRILTVSPGYAAEMKTVEGGFRLQDVVKMRWSWFGGILNGIDMAHWNPMTDPLLTQNYGPSTDFLASRAICKKQLQERLNLKVDPAVALVSFVGRLADQKGIDIILKAIDWLMADTGNGITGRVQIILMGQGERSYGDGLRAAEQRYPGRVCGYVGFDPKLEHVIYSGSDLFLMPSRYEPCGLPQMYAMRYGCLPIVTLCGGLKDSVVTKPESEATGFGILPLNFDKLKEVTYKALKTFHLEKKIFQTMQKNAMLKDFSWCRAMDIYEQSIDLALDSKPYVH